jgi:hypothetical protein
MYYMGVKVNPQELLMPVYPVNGMAKNLCLANTVCTQG